MRNKENIVPISRGEQLSVEKHINKVRALRNKAGDLYKQVLESMSWREKLLEDESGKKELRNENLITALNVELEELSAIESELLDKILVFWKDEDILEERWLKSQYSSEIINITNLIDQLDKKMEALNKTGK